MNLKKIYGRVRRLITETGDYLHRRSGQKKTIAYKGAVDLVTRFDRESQHLIVSGLAEITPDFGVLSEEGVSKNTSAKIKWIVDPLDGTTNFAHNLPIWSISIALEAKGRIVLGLVYDPARKELFSAVTGKGAFLNNRRIRVSKTRLLGKSLLVTGFPYDVRESKENNLDHFSNFAVRAQAVRRLGSAALDLCYTACGRFDGYWELKLSAWDQAAGCLILKEAGGKISDFGGKPFNIYGNEVLGTNGLIHRQMMHVLQLRAADGR